MIETRTLDKPGRLYDADEQCQLAYGQAAKFCGGGKFLDVSTESDKCDCPSKLKILIYISLRLFLIRYRTFSGIGMVFLYSPSSQPVNCETCTYMTLKLYLITRDVPHMM